MKLLCKPKDIYFKISELKSYRIWYVYNKFDMNSKFEYPDDRKESQIELLRLDSNQLELDLSDNKLDHNTFHEFTNKVRVAMEYNAEIYIETFDEVMILDFINKKLNYYEDLHKNEQTRTT